MNTKMIFPAIVLVMLIQASETKAQLTTGGEIAGGYMWIDSKVGERPLNHYAGNGKLWLSQKAEHYDWRVTMDGSYKDQEGEMLITDLDYSNPGNVTEKVTMSYTRNKPLNINTRCELNWRQPDKSAYKLWAQYGYHKGSYTYFFLSAQQSSDMTGAGDARAEQKDETSHRMAVGYSGTTMLNAEGLVLKSKADLSLTKRTVEDAWCVLQMNMDQVEDNCCRKVRGWDMHPDYTDWHMNASLQVTDTVIKTSATRLLLGGGLRLMGESERYLHGAEASTEFDGEKRPVECLNQHATGFRCFVEPFLTGEWTSGKWSLGAEYGARLYHTTTTDKKGTGVAIYNLMDPEHPLGDTRISHFTPLVTGQAKLTRKLSKHHSLTVENKVSNRLPCNQQSVLGFEQSVEYNKVILGNPHIKPETSILCGVSHTYTNGCFSATTSASAEWTHNLMNYYLYSCTIDGWKENAQIAQNVADVKTYTLREQIAWNGKWLTANAEIWGCLSHHTGIGSIFGGTDLNDSNWGWKLGARAKLGHGWQVNTDFQYMGGYKTVAIDTSPLWQKSTLAVEKQFKHFTLFMNAHNLIDPAFKFSMRNTEGKTIYDLKSRMNNRMVMIGCRWTF
jgi:hypothetical protein